MKEENGREKRNATNKYGSAENNMQYPSGMEKLKVGIEEINFVMPPRGNVWVVEEGQGVDSVHKILHLVMGKEMNIKTMRWKGASSESH